MRSRSSGLMRMQVSESVSVKIWGEKHRELCVPDAPSSPCLQLSCGKLCGAGGGDAGLAPHLPEDEVQQQRVVEAVLGVENLPGGTPAQLSWGKSPLSMQRFGTNLIPVQRGQILFPLGMEQMMLLTPCSPDFPPCRMEQAVSSSSSVPALSPALHLLADVYFPGHIAVGVEVLAAAAVKLSLHLLCLRWELP